MHNNTPLVERLLNSDLLQAEWVLYFLLGLLGAAIFVIAWKIIYFGRNRRQSRAVRAKVAELMGGGDLGAFQEAVGELPGVEARILHHGLHYAANGTEAVTQQFAVATAMAKARMELGLTFLGTVGSNAPFVGLFGTVLGIIKAFRDLSLETRAGASAVMAGISEALVATAVGLLVAIPAVVAFNYLQRQVKQVLIQSDTFNQQILLRLRAGQIKGD